MQFKAANGMAAGALRMAAASVILTIGAGMTAMSGKAAIGSTPDLCGGKSMTSEAVLLKPGPHLFIDDFLIAASTGISRRVCSPSRFQDLPIVPSAEPGGRPGSGCSDKEVSVAYDPATQDFLMWHYVDMRHDPEVVGRMASGAGAARWTPAFRRSRDGVRWGPPLLTVGGGGACVLDALGIATEERYQATDNRFGSPCSMLVFFSADGLRWRAHPMNPVLQCGDNDIWAPSYDPLSRRYYLFTKPMERCQWTDTHGKRYDAKVRQTWLSTSPDFRVWTKPRPLFAPDAGDEGVTQWYGGKAGMRRGDHFIVMLRELRDDLKASRKAGDTARPEGYDGGVGYTVLAWTRDGETWQRDRYTDKFLAPSPDPDAWDHAHAWIGAAVAVGEEVWFYYGGYKYGHKYYSDRSIGLATMRQDRYVAREAGAETGTLVTPPVTLSGRGMSVNAAVRGELRVGLTDLTGKPLPGFALDDCAPVHGDGLGLPVLWKGRWERVSGTTVRISFSMREGALFAFQILQ